jgi:capsular exopolysaccharide synthesis family protein
VVATNPGVQRLSDELIDLRRQEAQLSREFGDRWPEMIKVRAMIEATEGKLATEGQNVVALVQNEVVAAAANEESLARAFEAQKADAMQRDRKAIGFQALQREAESNRQIFDTLMQRAKETNISSQLRTNNIRLADEADAPTSPMWPNKRRNLLFSIFAGLILAVAMAFGAEYLDNKLKSPEEIRDELGLRCVGMVPKVTTKEHSNPMVNNGVPPIFHEAFRTVRTNVLFSFEDLNPSGRGGRSIVVTSTAPGEGKTLVASNLAIGLALAGQRVALLDGDMRRPRVHEIFRIGQEPGLSNVVLGTAKASEGLQRTGISGLWALPAGVIPPNPAELLASPRFKELLDALVSQFDWVVIDSPPTMAVIDASVLAHIVGGVLFVVSAETTSRPAATKALEQLDAARPNFLGAVLNRVDVKRNAFFYSPYYRREYSDYYSRPAAGER